MRRWPRPLVIGSLLSGCVAVSCLVSNVELVDSLPGTNDGGAGADGVAGSATGADGGDAPGPVGGAGSGGSDTGPGGRAGSNNSGSSSGGTSNGGNAPGGGSGGTSSGGGYTTDPTTWVFGGKGACETAAPALMCDDFETEHASAWAGGLPGNRAEAADAPGGDHIWQNAYQSAAMNFTPAPDGVNVSFWVRVPPGGDHEFIEWSGPGHTLLSFGIEGDDYRFRLASEPMAYSAPELLKHTRIARRDTWTCVELVYVNATFQATVTVLGEAPVKLALVGGKADAGIDEEVITRDSAAFDIGPEWTLGETGAELEYDEVRVVPLGQPSVCQDFIAANNP